MLVGSGISGQLPYFLMRQKNKWVQSEKSGKKGWSSAACTGAKECKSKFLIGKKTSGFMTWKSLRCLMTGWRGWCSVLAEIRRWRRLGKRRLWGDLDPPVPKGDYKWAGEGLLTRVCRDRTRGNGLKLKESRFRFNVRKKSFTVWVMRHWKEVTQRSFGLPHPRLDRALRNLF